LLIWVVYLCTNPNHEAASKILEQYENSTIIKREFTGAGFYTYFQVNDESLSLGNNVSFGLDCVHAEINGLEYGAGFILFIENGFIDNLEGYTYGGDKEWPEKITAYKFSVVNMDGSLTEL
jgi:hypothetical protein